MRWTASWLALTSTAYGWPANLLPASTTARNYSSTNCTPLDRFDEELQPQCLDAAATEKAAGKLMFTEVLEGDPTCYGLPLYKGLCVVPREGIFTDMAVELLHPTMTTRLQRSDAPQEMPWCSSFPQVGTSLVFEQRCQHPTTMHLAASTLTHALF
jgi:hypothetical protein